MSKPALPPISDAVILMAGTGSRLRPDGVTLPKPLFPLLGRPLISHVLETLARAGITRVHAVVGYEREILMRELPGLAPSGLELQFVHNDEWTKQNGISVLAAAPSVTVPFLLTMSDHLFDDSIIKILEHESALDCLNLAIDRKIESVFDLDDAMKVKTRDGKIRFIGKTLTDYDAVDTGMFICAPVVFDYLERAKVNGDCSLADGVRLAASEGKVRAVDIGDAWWQDVDTPEMLAQAELRLRSRSGLRSDRPLSTGAQRRDSGQDKTHDADCQPQMENPLR
jgi:1L-myo-inositol 1-phosphate cytidylyltransferase